MSAQKTVEIGESTYTVRPRTMIVDAELADHRGEARRIEHDEGMLQVEYHRTRQALVDAANAEPYDPAVVATLADETTVLEERSEQLAIARQKATLKMIEVLLDERPGVEALMATLDLTLMDEVAVTVGLIPPTALTSESDTATS